MRERIEAVKNSFINEAYKPRDIVRVSLTEYPSIIDNDLLFESNSFRTDKKKILSSQAIRRETNRTQVIPSPDNSNISNRITHTHEVTAIASTISEVLGLNIELTEAIAFGHDIGHGPFGHIFEFALKEEGINFKHEDFSGIVATFIERHGKGLNLTRETVKGILEHSRGSRDLNTNKDDISEISVVMFADKLAYVFSDINDLTRLEHMSAQESKIINSYFPGNKRDRINQCVIALMEESLQKGYISFSESQAAQNFKKVKDLMHVNHYSKLNRSSFYEQIKTTIYTISDIGGLQNYDPTLITALMSDSEIRSFYNNIHSYRRVNLDSLSNFGIFEAIQNGYLENQTYQGLNLRLQQKMMELGNLVQ